MRIQALTLLAQAAFAFVLYTLPASAQSVDEQLEALQRQMRAMEAQIEALKRKQAEAAPSEAAVKVKAKGAPQFSGDGFTFKVRGRLQADIGHVSGAERLGDAGLGTTTEFRRARLGVEGAIEGFSYKFEADFANDDVSVKDAYLQWKGPATLTLGHQKPPFSMEKLTSSRFTAFMERAGFTSAFDLDRMLGVRADKAGEGYIVSAGVFSDGGVSGDDEASGYAFAARAVLNPEWSGNQLHFGGWTIFRDDGAQPSRYRNRPLLHTTDTRFINTGSLDTTSDHLYGVEAAAILGPLYIAGEWSHLDADLASAPAPGLGDSFSASGAYVHAGYFFTGESRGYKQKAGAFDRTKPRNPVHKGGAGAFAINLGFDHTDLTDRSTGVIGGEQTGYLVSLTWIPEAHVRVLAQYGYIDVSDRSLNGVAVDDVDIFGLRAQVDW